MSVETLVLIPAELGLGTTKFLPGSGVNGEEGNQRLAVHSEQYITAGTIFHPFQGNVRMGRFYKENLLREHDVLQRFGAFDIIQELDDNRQIRQCNWVRFLVVCNQTKDLISVNTPTSTATTSTYQEDTKRFGKLEPNMAALFSDGQPEFLVIKPIPPHSLLVVQFGCEFSVPTNELSFLSVIHKSYASTNTVTQEIPLDLSKSLLPPPPPKQALYSPRPTSGNSSRIRMSQRSLLPCEVCGKVFDRPSLLKRHMRTHTGEKPHVCEVCHKGFSTSSSLNTHRRIHSGDKPHQCLVCGKRFTASSNLYYHRMTHTKEKPHKCGQCSKSFPTPGDLKAHMYIHNGSWPFRCNVCSRGFSKQTNLRNHLHLHTGDRPHPCKYCGKKFALACNLRAHIKTNHHSKESTTARKEASLEHQMNNSLSFEDKNIFTLSINQCNQWDGNSSNGAKTTVTTTPGKCTLPQPHIVQQLPCTMVKTSYPLESSEIALSSIICKKNLFNIDSNSCILDKSNTGSDHMQEINRLGYPNIFEDMWSADNFFTNQYRIPFSVAPFNISMPCFTSISLADLQALLLMQAANMAMLQEGNVICNDGKLLKKQMNDSPQNRGLLLT